MVTNSCSCFCSCPVSASAHVPDPTTVLTLAVSATAAVPGSAITAHATPNNALDVSSFASVSASCFC